MIPGATMQPMNHPNCRCINEREAAPRSITRTLFCYGGPWDGERRVLEADESEILLAGEGAYTAMVTRDRELLRWRSA
jgi:hypothetical protein